MNGRDLALGLVAGLALAGAVRKRGSGNAAALSSLAYGDLPHDMRVLLGDFMEERYGIETTSGEPFSPPARLPIHLVAVEPLYRSVAHDAWDDRGPAHVDRLADEMERLVPAALRTNPVEVARRLLQPVPYTEYVRGTRQPRPTPGPAIPPIVTWDGRFADGRHRLFAAHRLGITHLPAIEMADLAPTPTGSAARPTQRTDPALWEAVKAEVTASDTGGRPGQWSARKAQRSVQLYTERGGGYLGPKDPDNALARWTKQDWRTRSGGESLQTGERYLPAAAFDLLTPAEVGATTRAKRAGMRKGKQFVPQPPNIARKTKKAREGSGNVIASSGYDQTAMARTGPSAPVQHLRAHAPELLRGRVLDFGSGRGADAEALRATAYDPHHPKASVRKRPTGTFSTVLATYVLNVLPKDERHAALREAAGYVRPGGHLVLAVRPQAEVAATVSGWARNGDGHQLLGSDGARDRFQRGYTPDQLAREVRAVLGDTFAPVPLPGLSGSVVGVWRRA